MFLRREFAVRAKSGIRSLYVVLIWKFLSGAEKKFMP